MNESSRESARNAPSLVVLGTVQDGGYPHAGCRNPCCRRAWDRPELRRRVVSLAVIDPVNGQRWLVDCTPDFREQLHQLDVITSADPAQPIDGILLTHAHAGHYAGLIHLGREAMSAANVPVFVMPRMRRYLETNRPWSQLITDGNISLRDLADGCAVALGDQFSVAPFLVPHRDENSETVGFQISGPDRSALFLPDIDGWDQWDTAIEDPLRDVDVAILDGTFYSNGEVPDRDISQIPHPRISDSIARFAALPESERNKVWFVHFNHTNPVLDPESPEARHVREAGHHLAVEGQTFAL